MKQITIKSAAGDSLILTNEKIKNVYKYIAAKKIIIITDSIVKNYYEDIFPPADIIEIKSGEANKNLNAIEYIYNRLIELEADRSSFILGIGGGVATDIAGFAASTFMRGIKFGFIPSTLLAHVDAAIGGKNGVDFNGYKNMIGTINQPEFVICDSCFFKTLPKKEILCGLVEAIKAGIIKNETLFSFIEKNFKEAINLEPKVINYIIYESILIKADIVNADAKETGERKLLNLGHTFGHAIELTSNIRHGEAVSFGIIISALLSLKKGLLSESDFYRIKNLLLILNLAPEKSVNFDIKKAVEALKKDKKRAGNKIDFILIESIGKAVRKLIDLEELADAAESLNF
ncbi:MAG: 3-dehydroquinate synthase [Deltaproteobacteria bacterium]|nr:3-dehydroquinate synthase [Deltaproteobacteria bacterium]